MDNKEILELFERGFDLAKYAGVPEGFKDARGEGLDDLLDYFSLNSPDGRFTIYGGLATDERTIEGSIYTSEANTFSRYERKVLRSLGFKAPKSKNPIYSIPIKIFNIDNLEEVEKEIKRLVKWTVEIYEEVKTKENEKMKKGFTDELKNDVVKRNVEIEKKRKKNLKKIYEETLENFVFLYDKVDSLNSERKFSSFFNFISELKGEKGELDELDKKAELIFDEIMVLEKTINELRKNVIELKNNGKITSALRAYANEINLREREREAELDKTLTRAILEKKSE